MPKEKIGESVLKYRPEKKSTVFFTRSDYRRDIYNIVATADRPLNISEVMRQMQTRYPKIAWYTVRSILLELALEGKLEYFKSGRTIFFRLKRKTP